MPSRHLILYKPYGVVAQFSGGGEGRQTLKDFVRVPGVYPAGRLDRDSEGLLVLTSDGALQHRLTDPKFAHPRTYWVQIERIPEPQALEKLAKGVVIQDYRSRPARVRLLDVEPQFPPRDPPIRERKSVPTAWIELVLTEGRNRQVRHMTAAIGHPTLRLVRVAIGSLRIDGLEPGNWRDLTRLEVQALRGLDGRTLG
ncbi:MAG: pseudouridine synthase [Bryobacteraceae bacterium]